MTDESQNNQLFLLAFRAFLENSQDMIFVKDNNLTYIGGSQPLLKMVGLEKMEDLVGKTDFDFFEHDLAQQYIRDDRGILETGVCIEDHIERLPDQNGEKSYSSTSKYLIRDAEGNIVGLYGVARDVTTKMQLREEQENRKLSQQMFDNVLEADLTKNKMIRVEGEGWIQELNNLERESYSDTIFELTSRHIHPDYRKEFLYYYSLEGIKDCYNTGTTEFNHITHVCMGDDGYRWIEFRARVYFSKVSNTLRVLIFLKDKDNEVQHRLMLQKKAATDALTGLENRESALNHIAECLAEEDNQAQHALLFIDLDYFKQVNDNWGHCFGDDVLKIVARRLRHVFRGGDIFGRIGGDEFLVFLKDVPSKDKLKERVAQAVKLLSSPIKKGEIREKVTCSIGVVMCTSGNTTIETIYEQADKAMYKAKNRGREQFYFYEDL